MTKDTTSKIIDKLQKQSKEEGNLPLLLEFYQKLLRIQTNTQKRISHLRPTISGAGIQARLTSGQPLVSFDELAIDWALLREVFKQIVNVFTEYPELFGEIPERFSKKESGRNITKKAVRAWFTGKHLPQTLTVGINYNLIQIIMQSTLQPFLASHAKTLINSVKHEYWYRGYCPICGGIPDMAYLEKEVGARWLLCSRCDSTWLFHRLECPYCHTKDQNLLSFLADEKNLYRLYLCEQCKCYLKAIDLRKTDSEVLLPLERIYTLDLDAQARERGYHPGQTPVSNGK